MKKFSAKIVGKQIVKKIISPRHLSKILELNLKKEKNNKVGDDAQLKLYSEILPGDFLHYGYFDDPSIPPEKMSLHDIYQAQIKYGELLLEQVSNKNLPVLDIGCGMGGLINLLLKKGFSPVALTPNKTQIRHIKDKYPDVPLIEGKFEKISAETYPQYFGTVITSESLQYLKLDKALPLLKQILAPGGRWIASDYFRIGGRIEKSGHQWEDFLFKLEKTGWKIVRQQDITQNVLPTLRYADMWGRKIGMPLFNFSIKKLQKKNPGIHYLLEETIEDLNAFISGQLDIVNPERFTRKKKYMLLVIKKV